AKRHVGRQIVGGQQTTMPLKINMGGVIPVIFASSVLSMPQSLFAAFPPDPNKPDSWWAKVWTFFQIFHAGDPYYELIFLSLLVFFSFFYVSIVFNVEEVADNLRKHGGFMPGIRPGRATAEYLNTILTRLTTVGAVYLGWGLSCVCSVPSSVHAEWVQSCAGTVDRNLAGFFCQYHTRSGVDPNGHGVSILFWRHIAFDSGGRGDGYCR